MANPSVHIEIAGVEDAAEILNLQRLAYLSEAAIYDDYTIPPLMQTLEEIRADFADHVFLKALVDSSIIGSVRARAQEGTCHIGRLIVHPDHQNRGIGTQLMRRIEDIFAEAVRFELFTGERSGRNLHLYRRLGYERSRTQVVNDRLSLVYLQKEKERK